MEKTRIAALFIDLQKSFISGAWMSHFGSNEVTPLQDSFARASQRLANLLANRANTPVDVLLTQVPNYANYDLGFIDEVRDLIRDHQQGITVVNKPHNDILQPGIGGPATHWLTGQIGQSVRILVVGGCTLTSCVRVSASHIQREFGPLGLQTYVDLSLCGARASNHVKRCPKCVEAYMHGFDRDLCPQCQTSEDLKSPVDLAVEYMEKAGVKVVEKFPWSDYTTED